MSASTAQARFRQSEHRAYDVYFRGDVCRMDRGDLHPPDAWGGLPRTALVNAFVGRVRLARPTVSFITRCQDSKDVSDLVHQRPPCLQHIANRTPT